MNAHVFGPHGEKPQLNKPLDFEALKKGDSIVPETLEAITGYLRNSRRYSLEVSRIQDQIRRERPDLASHLRISKDAIVIMHDAEAESYSQRRIADHRKGIVRTVHRRASIDRSQLSPEQAARAEHNDKHNQASVFELMRIERKRRAEARALGIAPAKLKGKTGEEN